MNKNLDFPKTSKAVLASKSYKRWKTHRKLKIALTSAIGTATLGGALAGGFAWRASTVVPTLNAFITENNLQLNQNDSFAILKITETNKDHWIEPKIDLGESGLLIESQSSNTQTYTHTYKIKLGTAIDGNHNIQIELESFETVTVGVSVIPAKEITASIDSSLQYLTDKTAKIIVTALNNASVPIGTPELGGFKFTPFAPVNGSLEVETIVSWDGASTGVHELTITNGSESTTIKIFVDVPKNLTASVTNNLLQIGTDKTAILTVTEVGVDQWILPTVEASTGANLSLPTSAADWTVTGTTAYATISLTSATIAGTYTITVKNSQFSSDATTSLKVSPQKSLKAELMQNDLRAGVATGQAIIQVTEENTTTWVDPTISSTDLTDAGLSFDGNWTAVEGKPYTKTAIIQNSDAIVGSHDLAITAKDADNFDFLSTSVNVVVLPQKALNATITNNNLQQDISDSTATLTVTQSNVSLWVEPTVDGGTSGLILPASSSDWTDTTDPLTKTTTIGLGSALAGSYTLIINGSEFASTSVTLVVLESKTLSADISNNSLQIGLSDTHATLAVTFYNGTISSTDLQVTNLPSWLTLSTWTTNPSSPNTFFTTISFSGSGTPADGLTSLEINANGFASTTASLTVLPQLELVTTIMSNDLKAYDATSSAIVNVKKINVGSRNDQPQIDTLPSGLVASWVQDSNDPTLWVCTLNASSSFQTVGDFSITFVVGDTHVTQALFSLTPNVFEITGDNYIRNWFGHGDTVTYTVDDDAPNGTWSLSGTAPTGVTLNSSGKTAEITYANNVIAGTYNFTLTYTVPRATYQSCSLSITMIIEAVNDNFSIQGSTAFSEYTEYAGSQSYSILNGTSSKHVSWKLEGDTKSGAISIDENGSLSWNDKITATGAINLTIVAYYSQYEIKTLDVTFTILERSQLPSGYAINVPALEGTWSLDYPTTMNLEFACTITSPPSEAAIWSVDISKVKIHTNGGWDVPLPDHSKIWIDANTGVLHFDMERGSEQEYEGTLSGDITIYVKYHIFTNPTPINADTSKIIYSDTM